MATLDHLVLATPDVAGTVAHLEQIIGVWPVHGGRHTATGTWNALLGIDETAYLEIVGPDPGQPDPPRPRPFGIDGLAEPRLVAWAVAVTDIDARIAAIRGDGYDPGPVYARVRRQQNGVEVTARTTDAPVRPENRLVPFLVDWGSGPHPAAGLPRVELVSLIGVHPNPVHMRSTLQTIGADLALQVGLGTALIATLSTPNGVITLL